MHRATGVVVMRPVRGGGRGIGTPLATWLRSAHAWSDCDSWQRSPASATTHSWLTMSTEISTAGIVPLFSSQWVVFRSSGQPTPGP